MATLREKTALVVGAGSLGGPVALALAAAGVGRLVLVDSALVELPDLAAQPLLRDADVGQPRAAAAVRRLARLFPGLELDARADLDARSAVRVARSADVVVDASSRFDTMFLVNDAAVAAGRPLAHAGLLQLTAQLLTVVPGVTGCLRCLFEGPPPGAASSGAAPGVLGPMAGFAGSLLGAEAVRLLEGGPGTYRGRLLVHEARSGRSRCVPVRRRAGCAACGGILPGAGGAP
ncbi:HesA/MoeB/ThiF family protein [Anaeromyxobacter oryzae]|uniref:THIF-type NAD/FAD binding fold domain-containing protein n=1 Tax=Anaeromyxobacter oryzae TaxID=2918170 RepID=A0ABM7X2U5_9BACT|nr:ThiF family adenylyltransferase [Anaeromyxobacter oryzae]BDG06108.1 hypothetical protein AMOR_51040 [Anaeromyxobacter oryzae]